MSDSMIDPVSRDYVIANGSVQLDPANGLLNAAYLRLMTPLGSYWADPDLGSKLYLLRRMKDLPRVAVLAKQYAEQALAPLIKDGRASVIDVSTQRTKSADVSGRLNLLIEITDAGGRNVTFTHPVTVL